MGSFDAHILRIEKLGGVEHRRELCKAMGKEVKKFVLRRFSSKTDPRGHRWKKRTRAYAHPILDETGEMRKGWSSAPVRMTVRGFSISNTAGGSRARYHQTGTRNKDGTTRMPARQVFPTDGTTPKVLMAEFRRVVKRVHKEHFRK